MVSGSKVDVVDDCAWPRRTTVRRPAANKMPAAIREKYEDMARKIYPPGADGRGGYAPGQFGPAQRFVNTQSPENMLLVKESAFAQNLANIWELELGRPEDSTIPENVWDQIVAGTLTGDSPFHELQSQLASASLNYSGIASVTGQPRMTPFKVFMDEIRSHATPRTVRSVLRRMAIDAWSHVGNYQNQWENFNKDTLVPGMEAQAWTIFDNVIRGNPNTQQIPTDARGQMQGLSKDPKLWYKGLTKEQKERPLTATEARETAQQLRMLEGDARPEMQEAARKLRRALGITVNPPWEKEYLGIPPYARPGR